MLSIDVSYTRRLSSPHPYSDTRTFGRIPFLLVKFQGLYEKLENSSTNKVFHKPSVICASRVQERTNPLQ